MVTESKRIGDTIVKITIIDSIYNTGKTKILGFISGKRDGAFMVYDQTQANETMIKIVNEF